MMKNIISTLCVSLFLIVGLSAQTIGLKVTNSGDVGIGTASPSEKLDVDGAIRMGSTNTTNAGTIRFNPANCDFEGYDGSNWVSLSGGAANCNGNPPPSPTCNDGIQNQGETGIDCGGPCTPCGGGGGGGSCESFPSQNLVRDLGSLGYTNEYNIGGTGISGDGELCWKVAPHVGNTQGALGLSDDPTSHTSMHSIDFGFQYYIRSTNNMYRVYIRENAASKGLYINQNTDIDGMVFCIRRTGGTVEYLIDGSVVYTSNTSNTNHLFFDNSHYDHPSNSIWGHRPSSAHYYDIEICPNGTYSVTAPQEDPSQSVTSNNNNPYEQKILSLEQQVQELTDLIKGEESFDMDQLDVTTSRVKLDLTDKPALEQNKPNPFANHAIIRYYVPTTAISAELAFFDFNGRIMKKIQLDHTGFGEMGVDADDIPNGLYSYSLIVDGERTETRKMNIMK